MKKHVFNIILFFIYSISFSQSSNYIYEVGTLWHNGFYNIINSNDTNVFESSIYKRVAKALIWDRTVNNGNGAWTEPESWIYEIKYNDNVSAEMRIRKLDYTKEQADDVVKRYTPYLGKLPFILRQGIKLINIMKAEANFGGNNWNNSIDIYEGVLSERLINEGNMEEMLLHEGAHSALDYLYNENWKVERDKDLKFVSRYAYENPDREDIAETFAIWLALRNTENRLNKTDTDKITKNLANRIAYLNSLNFNINPTVGKTLTTKRYDESKISIFPNPVSKIIHINSIDAKAYTIFNIVGSRQKEGVINTNKSIPIEDLKSGVYFLKLDNHKLLKFIKN